jgi:hypothetical protein
MSDLFWLTEAQMERLKPFFPLCLMAGGFKDQVQRLS